MQRKLTHILLALPLTAALALPATAADETKPDAVETKQGEKEEGFTQLFDGKSLDGWKINENPESFKVEDGTIVANGERSHLFYVGDDKPFKNFHLKIDVKTTPGSNSGIYFHT